MRTTEARSARVARRNTGSVERLLAALALIAGFVAAPSFRIGSAVTEDAASSSVVVLLGLFVGVIVVTTPTTSTLCAALAAISYVSASVEVAGQKLQAVDLVSVVACGAGVLLVLAGGRPSALSVRVAACALGFAIVGFTSGLDRISLGSLGVSGGKYVIFAGACLYAGLVKPSGTGRTMMAPFMVVVAGTLGVLSRVVFHEFVADDLGRLSLKFTSIGLILGFALYMHGHRSSRVAMMSLTVLGGAFIVESSRQTFGFLALYATVCLVGVARSEVRQPIPRVLRLGPLVAAGLALIVLIGVDTSDLSRLALRGEGSALQSNELRSRQADLAVDLIREDPLFGGGLARFGVEAERIRLADPGGTQIDSPHSEWLNAAVQAGVVGVVLSLGIVLMPPVAVWRSFHRRRQVGMAWLVGLPLTLYLLVIATFGDLAGVERAIVVFCIAFGRAVGVRANAAMGEGGKRP